MRRGKQKRSEFEREFQARLKAARIAAEYTQEQFAERLGIDRDTYAKYESRSNSILPLYLLPQVCELTGFDPWHLLTGKAPITSPERKNQLKSPPKEPVNANAEYSPEEV